MPKKENKKPVVGEAFRIGVDVTIKKFLNTDDAKEWEYPSSFTAVERAYIHAEALKNGLKSKSRGKGSNRFLTIYKRDGSAIMQKDATINLTQASRSLLLTLLHKHPVTSRERQDCLPPLERTKDLQEGKEQIRALGRLGGGSPQVPPASVNRSLVQARASLPVHSLRETILHTINDNQVTIITGHTGSGKTTQVPQYLLEWHERVGRPCRIICSEPRRISAVSVSERVALERGEKLSHSVGYQIRLEAKVSPYTVLVYCTSGVLLRTLMTGDGALASVTHVIIDEVHERDKHTDFLMIALREAVSKFRALRLVLLSATSDVHRYSAYFNNCPIVTVPGKLHEVKEYYLEDILKQTGYMSAKMEVLRREMELKKARAAKLNQWTAAFSEEEKESESAQAEKPLPEIEIQCGDVHAEMDAALSEAWTTGSESAFAQLLYFIQSEHVAIDYQHSETGVTALMVGASRGNLETVECLLALGADPRAQASNNFTALDWAQRLGHSDVQDLLTAYMTHMNSAEARKSPELVGEAKLSDSDKELLELYHGTFNDENVDVNLIVSLVMMIHNENNKGSILVFLPGYSDITTVKDALALEEKKMTQKMKMVILILHSNMQTADQKLVFKPAPTGTRKVILSTNIAQTSVTIDDVVYVIDSGKVKEQTYNAICGVVQLCTLWISKSCAMQRRGRAGRTQPGICYRLYSSTRYQAMPMYKTPEILCIPLQELCLYAKQLAPPNTSIVDFLSRAMDPPSSLVSRSAVALLKTIDALDTWEDLTDLGHHLVDLPVDPRYGKMLIYASVLKCLDPVLTIVCCLSYRDVFALPIAAEKRRELNQERARFAAGSLSDHMILLRVFQGWQEAKKQGRERQFCIEHSVNGASLEMVLGTRAQLLAQLRASGFVKSKGPGDIKYANTNSDNWAVVKAALVAGLYPNLARADRDHHVLRTVKEHKVGVHMSSVVGQGSKKGVVDRLPTDWVVYEELLRVGRLAHIRTATVVTPITVAIFAGPAKIPFDAITDTQLEGSQGSDSEEEDVSPEQTATLKLDDWIIFRMDSECAQLAVQLRLKWHSLLTKKLRAANKMLNSVDEMVINTIVRVLSTEEQRAGLTQPTGVGRRPYLMNPDLPTKRYGSGNKSMDVDGSSPTPCFGNTLDLQRTSCASPYRYFVIKAGQPKVIEASVVQKAWSFSQSTQNKIVQAYKGGKTVMLIFSLQGSGQFQGYARLAGDTPASEPISDLGATPPLPVEWVKRGNLPYQAARHLLNPYSDNARVQTSRDGQEIEPSVGEALCQLWETPPWGQFRQRNALRPTHVFHNTGYKM